MNWKEWRLLCAAALAAMLTALAHEPAVAGGVVYYATTAAGVPVKVVSIDLNQPDTVVTGQVASAGAGHAETFGAMVRRARPTVAITGTFFSTSSKLPIGDIVIGGELAHFGGMGTAVCVTPDNEVDFVRPPAYHRQDWSAYDFVVCSGPRLIVNGKIALDPRAEGFRDRHMLAPNARLAIGVTRANKMLFVITRKRISLKRLALAMQALGVVNATNLDGGSSIGLYYKGRTVIQPGRRLTNLILVYENRQAYDLRRSVLVPPGPQSAAK